MGTEGELIKVMKVAGTEVNQSVCRVERLEVALCLIVSIL